jgi:trehalose 6-phosphate phosphatase
VQSRILRARAISLYLNFDGTLMPLVAHPEDARLPDPTRVALERIAGRSRMLTTILTGRSLFDARKRTGVPGIVYAGNHGMEINGSGLMFVEPTSAACQEQLERICENLESKLKSVTGVTIQNKRLTATLHYLEASPKTVSMAEAALSDSMQPYAGAFRLEPTLNGFDILPATAWNKASAVQLIQDFLADEDALILYFGDHASDEAAFEALRAGITVKVGSPEHTAAHYWVANPANVGDFLLWLADAAPMAGVGA